MSRRVEKASELIKQELAKMILETLPEELGMVTLTDVVVSSDIKNAEVFVSCLETGFQKEVLKRLQGEAKNFQHELGQKLNMRYTPKLEFKFDKGLDQVNRVEEILEEIGKD